MMAWARWTLSAATVSAVSAGVVVKKAWCRHSSNRPSWPARFFFSALASGMRRTTSRPVTCSLFFFDVNAV